MRNSNISEALKNWIPVKLVDNDTGQCCRWLYLDEKGFAEPFFDETISRCKSLPENSKAIHGLSTIDLLPEWAKHINPIAPTAFIFHVSRCGSTLVSQLLAMSSRNIVLSEPPFIDELLRKNNSPESLTILKAAFDFYGAKRKEVQQHFFIKTDSWHIHFYKLLRILYPHTPVVLLYRRPDEVIRSHQKQRGMQAVPGLLEPGIFGFDKNEILQYSLDDYMAKVIETYFAAFIEILQTDKLAIAVNYNKGAMAIVNKIASLSGITISENELLNMQQRSGYHAKYPEQVFSEAKLEEQHPAYLNRAMELYSIEKLRLAVN